MPAFFFVLASNVCFFTVVGLRSSVNDNVLKEGPSSWAIPSR